MAKAGHADQRDFKNEFQAVYEQFSDEFLLFSYSLVGFDSKADHDVLADRQFA